MVLEVVREPEVVDAIANVTLMTVVRRGMTMVVLERMIMV